MDRPSRRTSITIDEAIANLMGYATGPIDLQPDPNSDCEEAWDNIPDFDLGNLAEERGVLDGEYRLAKFEKQPADVIAEKLSALRRHEEIIEQANDHLCAIHDELNRGERSMLRVDVALSSPAYIYVTLHSFNEWAKRRGSESAGAAVAETPSATSASPCAVVTKRQRGTTQLDRRDAIFAVIVGRELNPKALPRFISGKKGLKKEIRNALQASPLFKGSPRLFDKAWEDLFDEAIDGRLAYEE